MITSPINPYRYWKLEEIQSMLNQIEGYENVVIEFQYQQSDDWTKRKVWECRCGIKEQLVNGQYSWLLKYVFAIEANDEGDARTIAWQEAAERLVTDVWRTSINSFRKQQQELNKIMTKPKSMNEVIDRYVDNNMIGYNAPQTQSKPKPWLRQTWYWVRATLALSVMLGVCWFIAEHKIVLDIFVWTLGLGLIGGLVYCFKTLMGVVFKDDGFED
jgi:hypothetical protein